MSKSIPVVTVDGPVGAGKGTVAQYLSEKLGYHLLDSGALYRLSAIACDLQGVALTDEKAVAGVAKYMVVRFELVAGDGVKTYLNQQDVSHLIRNEKTAAMASQIAVLPSLRETLLQVQKDFHQAPGLVADGRDMGTVIFPAANVKLFLTASVEKRAERRCKQLKAKGIDVNLSSLLEEISARDERDRNRAIAPLVPASDAIFIDSSAMSVDKVCGYALEIVRNALKN